MTGGRAQMSETFLLGALLAVAGGFLDAYTYLVRGGVFANAQTGNIVLLGMSLARGDLPGAARYLVPILAFCLGVAAAELIRARFGRGGPLHWRQITVGAEVLLAAAVAFLPQSLNTAANVAVSFVCAMQVESFRKVNGSACATTMCTGNLRSGTELLFRFCRGGDRREGARAAQYYGIILCFVAGAGLGVWLAGAAGERAALFACALLLAAFCMMFLRGEERAFREGED